MADSRKTPESDNAGDSISVINRTRNAYPVHARHLCSPIDSATCCWVSWIQRSAHRLYPLKSGLLPHRLVPFVDYSITLFGVLLRCGLTRHSPAIFLPPQIPLSFFGVLVAKAKNFDKLKFWLQQLSTLNASALRAVRVW